MLLFLFTYLTFLINFSDCQFCKPKLTYHKHSDTCIVVVNLERTHEAAEEYCNKNYSGGHLVYILDKETNNFIANLLDNKWYHIGLNDIRSNGVYKWGNGQIANYKKFNANHNPGLRYNYVMMNKVGWSEQYNNEYPFICQTSAEENEFFTMNGLVFVNKTLNVTVLSRYQWKCGIHEGQNHNLRLLYRHTNGTIVTLGRIFGKELNHLMYPGCNSSGVYVCKIGLNEKVISLEGILKVLCAATYCYEEDFNTKFRVDSCTGNTEGKFCVLVYPEPTSWYVYKVLDKPYGSPQFILNSKYNINFSYTDEISSRGELHIRFYNVTSSGYGRYYIPVRSSLESSSKLYFNIAGPPQCPNNLTSEALSDNMVRLSWLPVIDKTSEQKFLIFKVDGHADVLIATVFSRNEEIMFYNVTGLSANINYSFYLQVEIGQSVTKCKQMVSNIVIKGNTSEFQDSKTSENNIALYIIPIVAVVIILVICVVIILLVRKRKQNQKNKNKFTDHKDYKYDNRTKTTSAQQSSQSNEVSSNNTIVCSTEVAENIYNNVLEHKTQQGAKVLKPARKSGSSVKFKDKVSLTTGKNQAATLPLGKTLVTWDDDVNVYENTRSDTSKQVQENKENPSSEEKTQLQELDGENNKPKEDSRIVSPEGLVYVSVEINRSSQTPKIVMQKPKVTDKKNTKDNKKKETVTEVKDAVEYSSLDYLATSVAAIEGGVGDLADTNAQE